MLTRLLTRAMIVATLAGVGLAVVAGPAHADYVFCPPLGGACQVIVERPGSPGGIGGGGGGGGGSVACTWYGETVPCTYTLDGETGWFNGADGCYYFLMIPQPPAGSRFWEGHSPGDGAVYDTICYPPRAGGAPGFLGVVPVWSAAPPPGFGGGTSPATLAAQAINQMVLLGPDIGIAPDTAGAGLVGLPVWMWTAVGPQTWGPNSATAAVPGLSVTATARATRIDWNMGDRTTVTCNDPGTAYDARYGNTMSACGHRYTVSSRNQPGGRYTIAAVTTWQVTWVASTGESGALTITRQSTTTIRIDELQVVTG